MTQYAVLLAFAIALICPYNSLTAEPPRKIPSNLLQKFTMGGQIPVSDWYIDGSYPQTEPVIFTKHEIKKNLTLISQKQQNYYGLTDLDLYSALEKYPAKIKNKRVAIIGSTNPWYESIAIFYGAHPTTIEYNKIISKDPRVKTVTVEEFQQNPQQFDAILSISSIEHDGLGRYGDPINPSGDIKAMRKMKSMLKKNGLLFLAVPIGKDRLVWNAHRIYGKIRLPMLLQGWKIVDSFGFSPQDLEIDRGHNAGHQPVLVLQPIFAG